MFITNQYFVQGFTAAQTGIPSKANPLLFKGNPWSMWNAGYNYGELLSSELADNAEPLERAASEPLEQGKAAYAKGQAHEDNPYGFGDPNGTPEEVGTNEAHTNWDKGWRLAKETKPEIVYPDFNASNHVNDALGYGLQFQRFGRAYRDTRPRMVPLIDQNGKQVGTGRLEIDKINVFVDASGTVWAPPTAWAYMAVCRPIHSLQDKLAEQTDKHYKRVVELLNANTKLVELKRAAIKELNAIRHSSIDDSK